MVLEVEAGAAAAPAAAPLPPRRPKAAEAAKPAAAAAPAPAASAGPVEIQVPDIGDFKEVEVIEVMVAVGDTIKAEQSLITVESDKASMEIPTSQGGVVKEVKVKVGDKVAKGSVVVVVEGSAPAAAAPAQAAAAAPAPRPRRRHRRFRRRAGARASGSGRRAGRRQPEAGPAAARFALGARSRASWA